MPTPFKLPVGPELQKLVPLISEIIEDEPHLLLTNCPSGESVDNERLRRFALGMIREHRNRL
jgi:hypothetical protein